MTCTANGVAEDLTTTAFTTVPGTCEGRHQRAALREPGHSERPRPRPAIPSATPTRATTATRSGAGDRHREGDQRHRRRRSQRRNRTADRDRRPRDLVLHGQQHRAHVRLVNVVVTDDQGIAVDCPQTTLEVGEAMTCTAERCGRRSDHDDLHDGAGNLWRVANELLYENLGTVTAESEIGEPVGDSDPSHYRNRSRRPRPGGSTRGSGPWRQTRWASVTARWWARLGAGRQMGRLWTSTAWTIMS